MQGVKCVSTPVCLDHTVLFFIDYILCLDDYDKLFEHILRYIPIECLRLQFMIRLCCASGLPGLTVDFNFPKT